MNTKVVKVKQGTFHLVNANKVRRVIEGKTDGRGGLVPGLGPDAADEDIIVEYDKIAGLIRGKEAAKVKTGCFYDFDRKEAASNPKVVYTFRINGRVVEVEDGETFPLEVQAAQVAEDEAQEEKKKPKKKSKK